MGTAQKGSKTKNLLIIIAIAVVGFVVWRMMNRKTDFGNQTDGYFGPAALPDNVNANDPELVTKLMAIDAVARCPEQRNCRPGCRRHRDECRGGGWGCDQCNDCCGNGRGDGNTGCGAAQTPRCIDRNRDQYPCVCDATASFQQFVMFSSGKQANQDQMTGIVMNARSRLNSAGGHCTTQDASPTQEAIDTCRSYNHGGENQDQVMQSECEADAQCRFIAP